MLIPATAYLEGVIGATWDVVFNIWSDAGQSVPLDLSETYDVSQVSLEIDNLATLTPTSGLTVAVGVITATLAPSVTATAPSTTDWRIQLVRLAGGIDFPLGGTCSWQTP
jgi:hypothetical protein